MENQQPNFQQAPPPPPPPPQQQYQPPPSQYQPQQASPQKKGNPILKIFIILIVLFVVGGIISSVVGFFVARNYVSFFSNFAQNIEQQAGEAIKNQFSTAENQQNQDLTGQDSATQDNTVNSSTTWKTYKNAVLGFQMDYPSDSSVIDFFSVSPNAAKENYYGPVLEIYILDADWKVNVQRGDLCAEDITSKSEVSDIVVDGVKGQKIINMNVSGERGEVDTICLQKDGYTYRMLLSNRKSGVIEDSQRKLFERMISTFKIF